MSSQQPTNFGTLSGGGGSSSGNLYGSVTYTTPSFPTGKDSSVSFGVNRTGQLNSFSTKTGSYGGSVTFTKKF
jgi:hypothetical protein